MSRILRFPTAARLPPALGAVIADPAGLLEGTGKYMRHVKIAPGLDLDETALRALIETAYRDMKGRVA